MEHIYTIPVNEAFEASMEDASCGCPFCTIYNRLEDNELDLILGASMMEPDIRIMTNKEGFCRTHYDMMFVRKNRLGMALTLESHLAELSDEIRSGGFLAKPGERTIRRIGELEGSCYVCRRIEFHFGHMIDTAVHLFETDEEFRKKMAAQPYICLPHYRRLLAHASTRMNKKSFPALQKMTSEIVERYMATLSEDVSWFCKKFDYRYDAEPWYNAKDSVERAIKFLRSDLHREPDKKKK